MAVCDGADRLQTEQSDITGCDHTSPANIQPNSIKDQQTEG